MNELVCDIARALGAGLMGAGLFGLLRRPTEPAVAAAPPTDDGALARMKKEVDRRTSEANSLATERDRLRAALAKAERERNEHQARTGDVASLQSRLVALEPEHERLTAERTVLKRKHDDVTTRLALVEAERVADHVKADERFSKLRTELDALKGRPPEIRTMEKIVEKRVEVPVDRIVEKIVEKVVEVPVEKVVEKRVEVPVDRIVEKRVEVPVDRIVEKIVEVPVDRIVEKIVEVPVDRIVEKIVEVPVDRIVEMIVEVPVDRIVEKIVEVPVDRVIEKIVEVPVDRIVERIVEVPVDRIVEKFVEVPVDRIVERIVDVPVDRIVERAVAPTARRERVKPKVTKKVVRRKRSPDDLKLIHGVGPVLEKFLNKRGVFWFRQVARWSKKDIAKFEADLPNFVGRIEREQWVASARKEHLTKYRRDPLVKRSA